MDATLIDQHHAETRERFDAWAESATFQRLRPWLVYLQTQVLAQIDWARTRQVLDVACGSGWAVLEAARRMVHHKAGRAFGCDISAGMLQQRDVPAELAEKVTFQEANAQELPFEDRQFDAVFCTAAFHHFPKPVRALREFRRVLRPGGVALVADPRRDGSLGVWLWDRLHRWFEKSHVMYYRRDEFRRMFQEAGYADVHVRSLDPGYAETKKLVRGAALTWGKVPADSQDTPC